MVVSCGTCSDQLQGYKFEDIFPGCRIVDIHEYLLEKGIMRSAEQQGGYRYHDPCHSPMKQQESMKTVKPLVSAATSSRTNAAAAEAEAARWASRAPTSARRCAFARKKS